MSNIVDTRPQKSATERVAIRALPCVEGDAVLFPNTDRRACGLTTPGSTLTFIMTIVGMAIVIVSGFGSSAVASSRSVECSGQSEVAVIACGDRHQIPCRWDVADNYWDYANVDPLYPPSCPGVAPLGHDDNQDDWEWRIQPGLNVAER